MEKTAPNFPAAGREVTTTDVNNLSDASGRAADRLVSELFRPLPINLGGGDAAAPSKFIIPYDIYSGASGSLLNKGVVSHSGNDGSVLIAPFRFVLGSQSSADPDTNWRGTRSAVYPGDTAANGFFKKVALSPTIANNRWDLIYATIVVGDKSGTQTRYVRDPVTGVVSTSAFDNDQFDTCTFGVLPGSEGATPTRPTIPADTGNIYHVPLAYVFLVHPFTGVTQVAPLHIHEVAPPIPLSRVTGAATLEIGNQQYVVGGTVLSQTDFTTTARPKAYLPPTMMGKVERLFAFDWDSTTKSHPTGQTTTIDDTIDWRNRIFKWTACALNGSSSSLFAWDASGSFTAIPGVQQNLAGVNAGYDAGFGQSFADESAGTTAAVASPTLSALANSVSIICDMTTGKLRVVVGSDPSARMFLWLEASGPFSNAHP